MSHRLQDGPSQTSQHPKPAAPLPSINSPEKNKRKYKIVTIHDDSQSVRQINKDKKNDPSITRHNVLIHALNLLLAFEH
jgi:hypothetical protein